ncbi:MAG TPA: putative Ig domain-containing protein, partial [Acidimicrobiales bacterium]|nr:putative Ig domain-containing protein [Acidimicrobiales bacterium]
MKVPKVSVRKIPAIVMATIIAMSIGVALVASPASAATTPLISTSFTTNTTGVGQWVLPTASGTNQACLTSLPTTGATSIPHCATGNDTAGSGALQLTTNTTTQVGSVFNTTSLPATQGLDITFNTYQFNKGASTPADGISFTLAAANPTNPQPPVSAGPSGGSLGYSTNQTLPGVPNGYLGIGFDVYGNFLNTSYGGSTCPTVGSIGSTNYPQNVTVRGPGNGTSGYCLVKTTANTASPSGTNNLPGGTKALDNPTATTHGPTDLVPVEIAVNPSATAATTASGLAVPAKSFAVDFTPVGGTAHSFTNALPNLTAGAQGIPTAWFDPTTGVPYQLTFGWTASTGGSIEYHDITTLTSSTLNGPLPTMSLSDTDNASGVFKQGTSTTNVILTPSLGSSAAETNPPTVTDTFPTGVVPGTATGTSWDCTASAGQTVTCTYTGATVAANASYPPITVPIGVTGSAVVGAGTDSAKVSSIDALPVVAADSFTVELLPGAPTGVSTIAGDASASVSFTAPVNDGGSAVTGYTITPYIAGVPQTPHTFNSTATTESVTGLTSGTAYTFKVAAINDVGTGPNSTASGAVTPLPLPSITTATLPAGEVGVAYSQTVAGTGGKLPYGWSVTTGSLPAGLTLNAATGVISGTPTTAGSPTFIVTLTDANGGQDTQSYTLTVVPNPSITTLSVPGGEVGAPYSQTLVGSGGTAPLTWSVTTGSLPAGLTLNAATGVISGTPTAAGSPTFIVTLTDTNGKKATQSYTLAVVIGPSITTPSLPSGEVGVAYSQPLAGTGGTTPYTWSVTTGSLPAGLTLNSATGVISGSPTAAGSPTFTVTLTDANSQTSTKVFTVVVAAVPSITTPSLPSGEVGVAYSQTLAGTGGATPYAWSVTTGSLPAGLTLNSATGVISGSPTTAGSPTFTVTLTDANNQTATHSYTVGILALPSITTATLPGGEVGVTYSQTLAGTGGATPYAWSVTTGSLPAGLALNPSTGVISGTPTASGPDTFTVTLTDANNETATQSYTVTTLAAPSITTATLPGGEHGAPYSQTLVGAGGSTPYTWSVVGSLPAGLTLNPATGVISGTPTGSGPSTFTVTLTDFAGQMASQSYTLTILTGPTITTAILPGGELGVPYSQTVAGAGGSSPYTWSVVGSLPAGLTLNPATGVISGTPTGSGPSTFTVTLTDAASQMASQSYTVTILAAPSITTATLPGGENGVPYSQTVAGAGGSIPYAWSVTAGSLPAGLTLDTSTGVISGTPTGSGSSPFTVTLTDAHNQTATQAYTVGILAAPSITTATLPGGEVGAPYSQTVIGTGGSTPYAWSVTAGSLPTGLTLNGTTGVISGSPTTSGPATFTV